MIGRTELGIDSGSEARGEIENTLGFTLPSLPLFSPKTKLERRDDYLGERLSGELGQLLRQKMCLFVLDVQAHGRILPWRW